MAATDVTIRPLEELDIGEISAIDETLGGGYRPQTWERRASYYIRRDPEGSFVAEVGGKVIGFMLGEVRSGEFGQEDITGWIEVMGVDPEFRGQSIGRQLADAMLARFREQKAVRVQTLIDQQTAALEGFFTAVGFTPTPIKVLSLELDS